MKRVSCNMFHRRVPRLKEESNMKHWYDERNNSFSRVLCAFTKILWQAEKYPVLPEFGMAYSEWEDITGYYHPSISVEMLSIAKMDNLIMRRDLKLPKSEIWTKLDISWFVVVLLMYKLINITVQQCVIHCWIPTYDLGTSGINRGWLVKSTGQLLYNKYIGNRPIFWKQPERMEFWSCAWWPRVPGNGTMASHGGKDCFRTSFSQFFFCSLFFLFFLQFRDVDDIDVDVSDTRCNRITYDLIKTIHHGLRHVGTYAMSNEGKKLSNRIKRRKKE